MKTWSNNEPIPMNRAWIDKRSGGFVVRFFGYRIGAGYNLAYSGWQFTRAKGKKSTTFYISGVGVLLTFSFGG